MLWLAWTVAALLGVSLVIVLRRGLQRRLELLVRLEELRAELRRACEAAQHAQSAKATFLATMSHELRTPLSPVLSYSEMLQEDAREAGLDEMVDDLGRIHRAGKKLARMIEHMLELAEAESGRMQLFIESFSLPELLEEVRTRSEPLLAARKNELSLQIGRGVDAVRTDRHKLAQTLLLLVENAAKFTKQGRIGVQAVLAPGKVFDGSHGDKILISVADTGIGMSAEETGRIFTPFAQADGSTTRRYGGTGMGLALSRHFCQMMGGEITVTSAEGEGSSFVITLPVDAGAGSQPEPGCDVPA